MGDLTPVLNAQGWMTTAQAAILLGVPRVYIGELVRSRKGRPPRLTAHRIGRHLLLRRDEVEAYKAQHPRLGRTIARRKHELQLRLAAS